MGKDDVASALNAMCTDSDVADRLAAGDFSDLSDAELTEAERAMVKAAADDIPDVTGFAVFAKYDGIDGESRQIPKVELNTPFGVALGYAGIKVKY